MAADSSAAEPRFAWVMAGVGFTVMMLTFGLLGSLAVFLKPLAAEFGWQRGELALGYTIVALTAGVSGVMMGYLSDRQPYRPMVLMAVQVYVGCLLLFSSVSSLWQFYVIYALTGALGVAALGPATVNTVGHWFSRNAGLAIGIVSAGGVAGQGLIPFLARFLITGYGWRWAYVLMAVGYAVVAIPVVALARTPPRLAALHAGEGAAASAEAQEPFPYRPVVVVTWLSLAVVFCCTTMATPIVHVAALISDKGYDPQTAAAVFMVIMLSGIAGRVLIGKLADLIGGLPAYFAASLIQTSLVYAFLPVQSLPALYALGVVYGLGYSAVMTCLLICARELAPPHIRGTALGIVTCTAWGGMGLGAWQAGYFFDLTGDYHQSFLNAALSGGVNLVLVAGLYVYTTRRRGRVALAPAAA